MSPFKKRQKNMRPKTETEPIMKIQAISNGVLLDSNGIIRASVYSVFVCGCVPRKRKRRTNISKWKIYCGLNKYEWWWSWYEMGWWCYRRHCYHRHNYPTVSTVRCCCFCLDIMLFLKYRLCMYPLSDGAVYFDVVVAADATAATFLAIVATYTYST